MNDDARGGLPGAGGAPAPAGDGYAHQAVGSNVDAAGEAPPLRGQARADAATLADAPDEALMLLVARGFVREPATELFRRHNRALFDFLAWQSGGDLREAEDIAQTAWLRVMSRCADYRPTARFRTFLFQIGRNAWLDARGSAWVARRADPPADASDPVDDLSPEVALALREDRERLRGLLLALPVPQREAVVLRFFSEMSVDEVAQTVGVGFETVKSRLRYAFRFLRGALEGTR